MTQPQPSPISAESPATLIERFIRQNFSQEGITHVQNGKDGSQTVYVQFTWLGRAFTVLISSGDTQKEIKSG